MAALTNVRDTSELGGKYLALPVKGKTTIYQGSIVVIDANGYAIPGFIFENSTSGKIAAAEVLGPCYIEDDQTVTKTATSASVAGLVIRVDDEGVAVEMGFGYTPAAPGA